MLSSEFVVLTAPLEEEEALQGVYLLNAHLLVHGAHTWGQFGLRGQLESRHSSAAFASAAFAQVHIICL